MFAAGILILRLVIGLTLAAHGGQKLFGWWGGPGMKGWTGAMNHMRIRPATPWAWASAVAELLGGLGLAVGLLTPLPTFAIIGTQLVAVALVHVPKGFFNSKGGFEYNLSIVAAVVAIALAGSGAYSLDALFGINLPEPVTGIVMTVLTALGLGAALFVRAPEPVAQTRPEATS